MRYLLPIALLLTTNIAFADEALDKLYEGLSKTKIADKAEKKAEKILRITGINKEYAAYTYSLVDIISSGRLQYDFSMYGSVSTVNVSGNEVLVVIKINF